MTCPACKAATTEPTTALAQAGCDSCLSRMLAATGAHLESAVAKRMTAQYRGALETLFGERWAQGNVEVKRWAGLIKKATGK